MVLKQLKILDHQDRYDISIKECKIESIVKSDTSKVQLSPFQNALAFPGLINSHDHLEFNLFPKLGNSSFHNYTEWGRLIHKKYKREIDKITGIPVEIRAKWGIYKNLLCGVTSVSNHGKNLYVSGTPVKLIKKGQCLHSVAFEKNWKWKLNNPLRIRSKCIIHSGEGIDDLSLNEITRLTKNNFFKRELIGVHGISMTVNQSNHFSALVWCPQSNFFLFNKTANVRELKNFVPIIFGTDSTLTSDWNIWDHLRTARILNYLNDKELFDTVTASPADFWELNTGRLLPGKSADLIIARVSENNSEYDSFYSINPENILLVIINGRIWMYDEEVSSYTKQFNLSHVKWDKINLNNSIKWVPEDLLITAKNIKKYNNEIEFPFRFA